MTIFTNGYKHMRDNGGILGHTWFALRMSNKLLVTALAGYVHAICPWLLPFTASTRTIGLGKFFETRNMLADAMKERDLEGVKKQELVNMIDYHIRNKSSARDIISTVESYINERDSTIHR